jgi:predicted aconitase
MGNSDGIEAAFWSAICGRTPKWGLHLQVNRAGTHLVRVRAAVDSLVEWDLLGKAIGAQLPPGAIPVIAGSFSGVDFQKLRQLGTSLAISSSCQMFHLPGFTPEARSVEDALAGGRAQGELEVDGAALARAYDSVCDPGEEEVDLVSLGCPHYDIEQLKRAAGYLRGRRIHPRVRFQVWTACPSRPWPTRTATRGSSSGPAGACTPAAARPPSAGPCSGTAGAWPSTA